jgi:hypothetical protein
LTSVFKSATNVASLNPKLLGYVYILTYRLASEDREGTGDINNL